MDNPLRLNIIVPTVKRNHIGQPVPLSQGDITGMLLRFDGAERTIAVSFVGQAFGLDGLREYADLAEGTHTLSLAVTGKFGVGKFCDPITFTLSHSVDAPEITLS